MKVFVIVTVNYGFAAYIAYPHTGAVFRPLMAPTFNDLVSGFQDMIEVSILGDTISVSYGAQYFAPMLTGQRLEAATFVLLLWFYIIMSTILLLNLLIAMSMLLSIELGTRPPMLCMPSSIVAQWATPLARSRTRRCASGALPTCS